MARTNKRNDQEFHEMKHEGKNGQTLEERKETESKRDTYMFDQNSRKTARTAKRHYWKSSGWSNSQDQWGLSALRWKLSMS